MRTHAVASPRPSLRWLVCALLVLGAGCGGDAQPEQDGTTSEGPGTTGSGADMDAGGDLGGDADQGAEADQTTPSKLPDGRVFEQFIFRETFLNCHSTVCTRELQFALRGGNIHRVEYGLSAGVKPLMDDEYDALMTLVEAPETMTSMREGWTCQTPPDDVQRTRHVSFQLSYWDDGVKHMHMQTVTDCFDNDLEDPADGLINLARALRLRYYEQL